MINKQSLRTSKRDKYGLFLVWFFWQLAVHIEISPKTSIKKVFKLNPYSVLRWAEYKYIYLPWAAIE